MSFLCLLFHDGRESLAFPEDIYRRTNDRIILIDILIPRLLVKHCVDNSTIDKAVKE